MTKTVVHGKVKREKSLWERERIVDMRKMKKGILMLVCMALLISLTACEHLELREAKPIEQGSLKVGMNLQIPGMCYLSEETSKPEGFEVELAGKLADKLKLELEIVDTSEENLLKSLDGELYDCVISAVGLADWNEAHYDHTTPYIDIASVKEETGITGEYTKIAVFTKKYNLMKDELEAKLQMLRNDGSLKELSEKYFGKDITISK
ncbi:MAG: transporter substrate-binding domain-containing protein [Blautia sp.]|mgnify:FL=1|nr:transporter substrate-binding domain-containing protein [Blautia sp.]